MIELLAIAAEDGWGIVEMAGDRLLVRPPYSRSWMAPVDDVQLERLLVVGGFEATKRQFSAWPEVVAFLRTAIVEAADPDQIAAAQQASRRLLQRADAEEIGRHLDRLEHQVLAKGQVRQALGFLAIALEHPAIHSNSALWQRTAELVQRCADGEGERQAARQAVTHAQNGWTQRAERRFGEGLKTIASNIARRGQIFPVGT